MICKNCNCEINDENVESCPQCGVDIVNTDLSKEENVNDDNIEIAISKEPDVSDDVEEIIIDHHMSAAEIIAVLGFVISIIGIFLPLHNADGASYFTKSDICSTIIIPISLIGIIISIIRKHRIVIIPVIFNIGVFMYYLYIKSDNIFELLNYGHSYSYRFYTILAGFLISLLSYLFIGKVKLKKLFKYDIIWITIVFVLVTIGTGYAIERTDYYVIINSSEDEGIDQEVEDVYNYDSDIDFETEFELLTESE